jgi:peptide/nickel transport system ATP-binding protein
MSALLEVEKLEVDFGGRTAAVRGASFTVERGETHCLVGESGCGKSVTALAVMNLLARGARRSAERLTFQGEDLLGLDDSGMARLRGNAMAMIFQEPMTSLNPAYTIGSQMTEGMRRHKKVSRRVAADRAADLLARVGITAPGLRLGQFPHQLSGGLRQRVMIAMALMCEPKLLIADEPTTALDVTVQAQILDLMMQMQAELGMAMVFISHNLAVVSEVADDVAVMYAGRIVEQAPADALFARPLHPYTRGLIETVPRVGHGRNRLPAIPGTVPDPLRLPSGCRFSDRCPLADDGCRRADPPFAEVEPGRSVACYKPGELPGRPL